MISQDELRDDLEELKKYLRLQYVGHFGVGNMKAAKSNDVVMTIEEAEYEGQVSATLRFLAEQVDSCQKKCDVLENRIFPILSNGTKGDVPLTYEEDDSLCGLAKELKNVGERIKFLDESLGQMICRIEL